MSATGAATDLLILLVASLLPALVYLAWIRSSERYRAEPWGTVLWLFAFGALTATIVAGILEAVLVQAGTEASKAVPGPEFSFLNGNSTAGAFFLVLVLAPFVEEGLKGWGVLRYQTKIVRPADGPVFGASVGLGFGFFETFLYGLGEFLVGGLAAGLTLIVIRSISSVLLHASSTAMFGQGLARSRLERRRGLTGAYYLLAVAMHATFNLFASFAALALALGLGSGWAPYADIAGLLIGITFAVAAINHVVDVIHRGDYPGASGAPLRYRPPPGALRRPPP